MLKLDTIPYIMEEEDVYEEVLVGAEITWDRGEAAYWRLPSTPMLSPLKWFCVNMTMSTAEHFNVSLLVKGKVVRLRRLCLWVWTTAFEENSNYSGFEPKSVCLPLPGKRCGSLLCQCVHVFHYCMLTNVMVINVHLPARQHNLKSLLLVN